MSRRGAPGIEAMWAHLQKVQEEFDIAIATYESWRPAAHDAQLRERMGVSYATQTFNVIRGALWRECVLALARIWDRRRDTIGLAAFRRDIQRSGFMDALLAYRESRSNTPGLQEMFRADLERKAAKIAAAIQALEEGGASFHLVERLVTTRHQSLAHRPLAAVAPETLRLEDTELDELFEKSAAIIEDLWSLLRATAYSPMEAASVWGVYARHFWAPVHGERTPPPPAT